MFDLEKFLDVFGEANIKCNQLYSGSNEIPDFETTLRGATAVELLEAAKKRGSINYEKRVRPTSRSEIIVGFGEGRATREIELIWWPNLYQSKHGKLTIRYFIGKANV